MATGKTHVRHFRFIVGRLDAAYDLSGDSRQFGSIGVDYGAIPVTGWSDGVNYFQLGRPRQIFEGYQAIFNNEPEPSGLDNRGTGSYTALKQYQGLEGSRIFQTLFMGIRAAPTIGDPAIYQRMVVPKITVEGGENGPLLLSMDTVIGTSDLDDLPEVDSMFGVTLAANQTITAAVDNASVDNGASSANGLVAAMYVTASDSGTGTFKVQDSPNDIAWSDVLTFSINGDIAESDDAYASGTIDRYLRFQASGIASSGIIAWCVAVRL